MSERHDDPEEARIVEYVAGTMPADERAAFAAEIARDPALAGRVRDWEEALIPLAGSVSPVPPSAGLWLRVAASLGTARPSGRMSPGPAGVENLAALRRSRGLWRGLAAASGAIAASLALFVAAEKVLPQPQPPRPGLVAVVNRSGELPALIIRVDPVAGMVQVRSLAMEIPAGRSLELWSMAERGKPRSLGVLAPGATRISLPAEEDRGKLKGAMLAVTVEPAGGTGDRGPMGPVVYSGKLMPEAE